MPTFEHPPEWWVSLANLTQWLHWPALSAIFSFGALMWAIHLADRNSKDARLRDSVMLRVAGSHLGALAAVTTKLLDRFDKSPADRHREIARSALVAVDATALMAQIAAIDPADFPTPDTAKTMMAAKVQAAHLHNMIKRFIDSDFSNFPREKAKRRVEDLFASRSSLWAEARRRHRVRKKLSHAVVSALKAVSRRTRPRILRLLWLRMRRCRATRSKA